MTSVEFWWDVFAELFGHGYQCLNGCLKCVRFFFKYTEFKLMVWVTKGDVRKMKKLCKPTIIRVILLFI